MRVDQVMTSQVAVCNPETSAAVAAEIMWNADCGSLPVVEQSRVVGMVTDRDLFIALGTKGRNPTELPVSEVMNRDVALCAPEDDVRTALTMMAARRVHRLPVVASSGELRGIVSLNDVVLHAKGRNGVAGTEIVQAMEAICRRGERKAGAAAA